MCETDPEIIIILSEPSWQGITVSNFVVEACIKPQGKEVKIHFHNDYSIRQLLQKQKRRFGTAVLAQSHQQLNASLP